MDSPQNSFLLTSSSLLIVLLLHFSQTSQAINHHCKPSACGIISNISYPFRLKGDPSNCGDRRFELACENNATSLYLKYHKYYVKEINYGYYNGFSDNSSIRVVDASINNDNLCSFPKSSAYHYNFTYNTHSDYPYRIPTYSSYPFSDQPLPVNFISCPLPLNNSSSSLNYTDITADCASSDSNSNSNSSQYYRRYAYIKVGHMNASELPHTCELDLIVMTSWKFKDFSNVSLSEIHDALLYGFELQCTTYTERENFRDFLLSSALLILLVIVGLLLAVITPPVMTVIGFFAVSLLLFKTVNQLIFIVLVPEDPVSAQTVIQLLADFIILAPRIIIFPFALWLLIHKFRGRRLSIYNTIECFLRSDNKLVPIRYSYSNIKKMTKNFQDKLGEGGYGTVYKGKLRSGHDVAIKLLGKSRASGQDFMNEISTIGRIHHVNVVKLVGYCAEGSKRALVFDFMSNGSLEKYIFDPEKLNSLNWDSKYEIIVGVARGIKYLHQGCDVQILHFDIKPHNILLDDNFVPKISDFGLAKFCSSDKKTVTLTAARGTIGYVAPELISRSIGAVSYKADVYSFGMLLIEMVGLKRDLIGNNGDSSKYFPIWIYDCFEQGKDIEIERAYENDGNDSTRKLLRKMTIVALWCIQMNPEERPSMNKVLEMLEADVERLQIPNYPSQSTQIVVNEDQTRSTCSTETVSLLQHDDASSSVEITVQQ